MQENLILNWLETVWSRRPGGLLKPKSLLVWDSFRCHMIPRVKDKLTELKSDVAVVLEVLTSILQLLDVTVNRSFKSSFRRYYNDWMSTGNHDLTLKGKIKHPTVQRGCDWILAAWESVKPETIVKGFLKCGISNSLDRSEDDMLWNTSDSDTGSEAKCSSGTDSDSE